MKTIALVGLYYDNNLGDPLLFLVTQYMCKFFSTEELNYKNVDFFARDININNKQVNKFSLYLLFLKLIKKLFKYTFANFSYYIENKIWEKSLLKKQIYSYFLSTFKDSDAIIIMGAGTIKYDVRLNFAPYYKAVIECAKKCKIPVFINAAGVESQYRPNDFRCKMFKKSLNDDIIKIITTRDDIETLKKFVQNPNIEIAKISDIGVWSSNAFNIKKDSNSNIIGLGVITPIRFKEYGKCITAKQYEEVLIKIIKILDNHKKIWKIFNNGDPDDIKFAEKLCIKLGKNIDDFVITPSNPIELVGIISKFKGIITSRLHSCIIAYSLNIPFVAIEWNNKLSYFAQEILVQERIIDHNRFFPDIILEEFNKALKKGYDMCLKEKYKETSKIFIKKYLENIGIRVVNNDKNGGND